MRLLVDSEVRTTVLSGTDESLLFEPSVDWSRFTKPNIVDDY